MSWVMVSTQDFSFPWQKKSGCEDDGFYGITILESDGMTPSPKIFNFTINNVLESPYIKKPILQADVINASVAGSNIFCQEDNFTTIRLWVEDNDFKVNKSVYDEILTLNLTIEGNPTLFSFLKDPSFPTLSGPDANRSLYTAEFTPGKSDVGYYKVIINATDRVNKSDIFSFNLTVNPIDHSPVLMNFTNYSSSVYSNFYLDINATDVEDKNDSSGNLTYSYTIIGTDFINNNETIFNLTSGKLNYSFGFGEEGIYFMNITVNDSSGYQDHGGFWIFVYDTPYITYPSSCNFYLKENVTSNLTFRANHSLGNNLTYNFYLNGLRENFSYYGNNSNLTWQFTPNFSDETYGIHNRRPNRLSPSIHDG